LDPIPPTITITSQLPGSTYSASLTLWGTAADNVGVTQVTWTNSRGGSGIASGTTSWTASGIVLQLGTNVLTVAAQNAAGNVTTAGVTVARMALMFTDDPLAAGSTLIKAVHITELRAVIDSLRATGGLAAFPWTDPVLTPGSTPVNGVHLAELRTAVSQAYQAAGLTPPTYTDPMDAPGVTVIRAVHLSEVRAAVSALP
jgi:hypothetical protein